jgi:hypothetical protein
MEVLSNAVPVKLHGYLLSTSHPIGRFKAAFFARLGYTSINWQAFDRALREQHLTKAARLMETTRHGRKFEIRAILKGPSGQSAVVLSAWMIRTADSVPRFVTAYPGEER